MVVTHIYHTCRIQGLAKGFIPLVFYNPFKPTNSNYKDQHIKKSKSKKLVNVTFYLLSDLIDMLVFGQKGMYPFLNPVNHAASE